MTTAEKKAIKARAKDLWYQGTDRMTAQAMAEAEFRSGLILPVVNERGKMIWWDDDGNMYAIA